MSLIDEAMRTELVRMYHAAGRHYHDLRHIETLLDLAARHPLDDREAVEAAIWFHDAIYDPRRKDNEEKSAELAVARLRDVAANDRIARIAMMIRATAGHALPECPDPRARADCALFLDMDLAILAGAPAAFAAYERDVRREYAWLPEPAWMSGRRRVLESFLARPAIYLTDAFRRTHEARARRNLTGALAALAGASAAR
jgi:predicted metal-dependent HD superfamily phosphohydrolase